MNEYIKKLPGMVSQWKSPPFQLGFNETTDKYESESV